MADSQNKQPEKAVAEAKQQEPKAPPKKDTSRPAKKSVTGALAIVLVIAVGAAAGAGGYYLWQQQLQQLQLLRQQSSEISRLKQQLQPLQQDTSSNTQGIQANTALIRQLESHQQQISEIAQQAIDQSNRGQRDWILAEVDYLLRLANRRLQIARDINSAIAALQAADQRIHQLGDLNLLPVRKQLAKDIAELKALHQVDVDGIVLGLEQMINHLDGLPFKSVQEEIKTQIQDDTPEVADEKPQGFVDSLISTVKNIGDIKVHQRSIQPASSAQQQQQLEQILRTHLLAARLAVLRFDQTQFIHDLQQAQQLLHTHYQQDDNRVTQMQSDLAKFSSINLQPELPTITSSWNMLQDIDKKASGKSKKPAAAKPSSDSSTKQPAEVL